MKKQLIYIVILLALAISCIETDIVKAYQASEVEFIMSSDTSKTWVLTNLRIDGERQSLETCADSVWWFFEVIDDDSTASFEVRKVANCTAYDTTFSGAFSASVFETKFTDTLLFDGGDPWYMKVKEIRSNTLDVKYFKGGKEYDASYIPY